MPSWLSGACFKNEVKQKIGEEIEVDAQAGQVRVAGIECDIKGVCVCVKLFSPFHHTYTYSSLSLSLFLCAEGEGEKVEVEEIEVDGVKRRR